VLESTSLRGFAGRCLSCSANGMEIESAGGSFHPRLRCYLILASLNRSLFANKVRDHGRHGRVEADHVQRAAVVRVGEGEQGEGAQDNIKEDALLQDVIALVKSRRRKAAAGGWCRVRQFR
jgi:hypothetical protein